CDGTRRRPSAYYYYAPLAPPVAARLGRAGRARERREAGHGGRHRVPHLRPAHRGKPHRPLRFHRLLVRGARARDASAGPAGGSVLARGRVANRRRFPTTPEAVAVPVRVPPRVGAARSPGAVRARVRGFRVPAPDALARGAADREPDARHTR